MPRPVNADAAATKQRILDSALELFAERGIDGVSLRELAADAKVSSAMIHHCFGGKDGLRQAAIDTMYSQLTTLSIEMITLMSHEVNLTPSEVFEHAVKVSFAFTRRHRAAARLLLRDVVGNGELDERRQAMTNGPFIDAISTRLSEMTGLDSNQLRFSLHSCITLVARYAVSSSRELMMLSKTDNIEEALIKIEDYLQGAVRALMRLPPTPVSD